MRKDSFQKSLTRLSALTIGEYVIEIPQFHGAWNTIAGAVDNIRLILNWFVGFSVVLAVGFIIYSGIQFMTSAGDAEKVASARKMLTAAVVGMTIVLLSRTIIMFFIESFLE